MTHSVPRHLTVPVARELFDQRGDTFTRARSDVQQKLDKALTSRREDREDYLTNKNRLEARLRDHGLDGPVIWRAYWDERANIGAIAHVHGLHLTLIEKSEHPTALQLISTNDLVPLLTREDVQRALRDPPAFDEEASWVTFTPEVEADDYDQIACAFERYTYHDAGGERCVVLLMFQMPDRTITRTFDMEGRSDTEKQLHVKYVLEAESVPQLRETEAQNRHLLERARHTDTVTREMNNFLDAVVTVPQVFRDVIEHATIDEFAVLVKRTRRNYVLN